MTTRPLETHSLIDEFLRNYEFSAAYEILIDTPPSVLYQSLLVSDFSRRWLARLVIALRTRKWMTRSPEEFEQQARRARDTPQFQSVTVEFSQNTKEGSYRAAGEGTLAPFPSPDPIPVKQ
jgi:hypothetical protein